MEIKKEDLIEGLTILQKKGSEIKVLYLGNAGLVHFLSGFDDYTISSNYYLLNELNKHYTIYKEPSKTVPLEKKVYDFVDVVVWDKNRDMGSSFAKLISVLPNSEFPYLVTDDCSTIEQYAHAEFI